MGYGHSQQQNSLRLRYTRTCAQTHARMFAHSRTRTCAQTHTHMCARARTHPHVRTTAGRSMRTLAHAGKRMYAHSQVHLHARARTRRGSKVARRRRTKKIGVRRRRTNKQKDTPKTKKKKVYAEGALASQMKAVLPALYHGCQVRLIVGLGSLCSRFRLKT